MQLTIERLRTLVLVAGVLLLGSMVTFLAIHKWKNPLQLGDVPKRLGFDIQQESNGVTFSHALGGHAQFKVHANRVDQLKQGNALLHGVVIDLYGEDGNRVDRIEGSEFEYEQKTGTAVASGPVQITLMRPGVAPAIAPKAGPTQGVNQDTPIGTAARAAAAGQVHVNTSGLSFNWNTGQAVTSQHVDFSTQQGNGSSMGAVYDSKQGHLVLQSQVVLHTVHGDDPVLIRAAHADFVRDTMLCTLTTATLDYRQAQLATALARITFRDNGSAELLNASGGLVLTTTTGGRATAPQGQVEFNEHNQPQQGTLQGGVVLDSQQPGRHAHGSASMTHVDFTPKGDLRHAHLEGNVELTSDQDVPGPAAHPGIQHVHRSWHSPVADIDFRPGLRQQTEPAQVAGTGGVTVYTQTLRDSQPPAVARLAADQMTGLFAPGSVLSQLNGAGHTAMAQTLATGTRQNASGDRLEAHFSPVNPNGGSNPQPNSGSNLQIDSATLDGHVVLVQQPAAQGSAPAPAPMHAYADHAIYTSSGQWVHLTLHPRIDNGGMQLTSDRIDLSQDSGDAFAHGNVKATWYDSGQSDAAGIAPGTHEPTHVVAAEAQLHQLAGNTDSIATFRGHARLWQLANSVTAPVITIEKNQQSLEAHSSDRSEPVRVVLLNQDSKPQDPKPQDPKRQDVKQSSKPDPRQARKASAGPTVLRVRGGLLHYNGLAHTARMEAGSLGPVVAESPTATSQSDTVELKLADPKAGTAKPDATQAALATSQGQVERMTARGHVNLYSQGRRGTGEQLVYTGANEEYVLTGTPAAPPHLQDPDHGWLTGTTLIFHGRDSSVTVEGGSHPIAAHTSTPH